MRRILSTLLVLGLLAPTTSLLVGCDDTLSHEKTVEQKSDGTTVKNEKKVTESPNGTITKTEEHKVDHP
jgi:hypothetical protein